MKKKINILLCILLILAIMINVCSILNIPIFGLRTYRIASGSMEPYLKVNDIIIIKTSDDYKVNDIVTYKQNNEYITHRIIAKKDNEIITKGDANNTEDQPIKTDYIVGKLVYKLHIYGTINFVLSKPLTWVIILLLGILIIFVLPEKKK